MVEPTFEEFGCTLMDGPLGMHIKKLSWEPEVVLWQRSLDKAYRMTSNTGAGSSPSSSSAFYFVVQEVDKVNETAVRGTPVCKGDILVCVDGTAAYDVNENMLMKLISLRPCVCEFWRVSIGEKSPISSPKREAAREEAASKEGESPRRRLAPEKSGPNVVLPVSPVATPKGKLNATTSPQAHDESPTPVHDESPTPVTPIYADVDATDKSSPKKQSPSSACALANG